MNSLYRQNMEPSELRRLAEDVSEAARRCAAAKPGSPSSAVLERLSLVIDSWADEGRYDLERPLLIAFDGRSSSGKTTAAADIQSYLKMPVFHMDDFYLPPALRTEERLSEPGGNVHRERFLAEILKPLAGGETFSWRPLICGSWVYGSAETVTPVPLALVEGANTLHPVLRPYYRPELSFFFSIEPDEQLRRIQERNGPEKLQRFIDTWIPLEEKHIMQNHVQDFCRWTIGSVRP